MKEIDQDNEGLLLEFMHRNGPAGSFFWLQQSDTCWVTLQHVLRLIERFTLATDSLRAISSIYPI